MLCFNLKNYFCLTGRHCWTVPSVQSVYVSKLNFWCTYETWTPKICGMLTLQLHFAVIYFDFKKCLHRCSVHLAHRLEPQNQKWWIFHMTLKRVVHIMRHLPTFIRRALVLTTDLYPREIVILPTSEVIFLKRTVFDQFNRKKPKKLNCSWKVNICAKYVGKCSISCCFYWVTQKTLTKVHLWLHMQGQCKWNVLKWKVAVASSLSLSLSLWERERETSL